MNSHTDWHWNKDLKLIRSDRYNLAFAEECSDASVLEATRARVTAVRDEYQGRADKARSKSEKDTFTRAIQDKEQQIAWVLEKLSEVKSWIDEVQHDPTVLGGDTENKSTTSIPCLIIQPKHPEVKGVIKQDLGVSFVVYISSSGSTVTVSKLFVYPDFSESVGQLEKIPPSKKPSPPSKIPPACSRRKKGDGTGYIYRRTITRIGKQYQESYYRYRDAEGKLRSKYIPQRLLDKVEQAESHKKSVADILVLLGGDEISRGEQFNTLDDVQVQNSYENNESISISRGEQITPPSTKRRKQGYGAGYIECKPIKRGNKEYKQYWYHWEIWSSGDRLGKKSKYIPNNRRSQIEKMNNEKAPVEEILKVLSNRSKRKK